MGYLDTRQKIIDTLTGRAVGTQIQPINHQEFALALLDYIRQVELITASTLVGTAERGTVPVQSDKANLAYVSACPVGETVVFENFHGQDGQPLQYTADVNSAAIIILTWNKEYWIITAVPASVLVTADNVNYTTSIRKTYANKASMEADTNPVDEKNIPITNGQLVSVVNNSDSTYNGIYAREGAGWTFQSGFNFGLVQTTGQNVNHAMSQKATTDALNAVEEKADTATRILPFDGVVVNPAIEAQHGTPDYDSIVFASTRGLFLAEKAGKYYNSFPGAEHYNKNMKARTDRLYLRTDTQLVYICDGASLQPFILSESDKAKMGSYPAQFVMDFGLVESQAAGEQMAAASEVAGNRNISFIRFQVKGVSKLKTTLIMQWPNGINQTAQIMCVDKAQWRRNVTGATGVKGDPTNAFQWERIAPQRIVYNASNRKIRLEDYERMLVSDVELPIATPTQHGLMSAADKVALDKATEKADTALRMMPFDGVFGNPTIETQGVSSYDAIIFDDIRCLFLARKNNKFYMSFIGIEDYNAITSGTMKARTDRIFFRTDTKRTYIFNGTALSYLSISDEEVAKLANYPNTPLEIPLASEKSQGLMSAEDKTKLSKTKPVEEVTWTSRSHMNAYTECGEFHIKGERTNENDGMPILNAASGHTIDATLTVLDSSLKNGTGENDDICVTHILRLSNRTGGDGHIFIRTAQAKTKSQLASAYSTYWGTWEKLMGMFEKNAVANLDDLDGYTTNGMYSGIYAGTSPKNVYTVRFLPGDTFLMITINGYAASQFATPQITQLLYKLPAKTSTSKQNAEMYLRTGSWNADEKKWVWGTFSKIVTNADLSAKIAALTSEIDEKVAQVQELATQAKTDAARAQGTADSALSEAIEGKSAAANAFGAANNAQNTADAAQEKNAEQDERLARIENAIESFHAPSDYVEMTIQNDKAQRNVLFWKIEWIDDLEIDGRPINTEGLSGKFYRSLSVGEHKVRFHVSQENRTQRGLLGWADDEAAGYLSHVTRIVIPEGWTELPANCFENRKHLEEVVLPSTMVTIGGNCFQSLPALRELILPPNVTTINWSAINDCASLKSIRMGGNESLPLSLASDTIRNCPALTCIEFLPCQLTFTGSTSPFQNLPQLNALICHLTAAPNFEPSTPFGTIGSGTTERKTLYRPAGVAFYDAGAWLNNLRNSLGFYVADL